CVSNDGGVTFAPRELTVGEGASAIGHTAAIMVSDTVGFVATSDFSAGAGGTASIFKTRDAGATFVQATIPASVNAAIVHIADIFFAPGGTVGYAVGQFGAGDGPLLLKTTVSGVAWVVPSASGALHTALGGAGTFKRLYTGFALDA